MKTGNKQKKVICIMRGGIGNQLFCYATARRLALVNDAELVIDHITGFGRHYIYNHTYQLNHFHIYGREAEPKERLEPFGRLRRYLNRRINKLLPFEKKYYIFDDAMDFDRRVLDYKVRGTVYLDGYWQSERYFKDVEKIIRQDLQITPPVDKINQSIAEKIRSHNAVAVHIRFFDAPSEKGENNVSAEYYYRAIIRMEQALSNAHYYIFSDRPEDARLINNLPDHRLTVLTNNQGDKFAYADLWLMQQCQHFIIANSTFSWWGAWLSLNPEKIVIAPNFEKRYGKSWWGFDGLIPEGWIKL